jgi:L-alanine-DL-glutamate epimerase-like enolase superfamily enzyme
VTTPALTGALARLLSHLATLMSAHFAAVVPDLRIMEIDLETVPWQDELVTVKPRIDAGHLRLPTDPGWSIELNEATVRAHPPRTDS